MQIWQLTARIGILCRYPSFITYFWSA